MAEGGKNESTTRCLGRMKWPNLVLEARHHRHRRLFEWLAKCSGEGFEKEQRKVTKQTGTISLLDAKKDVVRSWKFRDAMPVRWTGPSFAATASALALEELEVSHGGFSS